MGTAHVHRESAAEYFRSLVESALDEVEATWLAPEGETPVLTALWLPGACRRSIVA